MKDMVIFTTAAHRQAQIGAFGGTAGASAGQARNCVHRLACPHVMCMLNP
jgi:hypothetical protein